MVLASYPVTATGASFAGRSFSSSREAIETTLRLVASQLGARTAYVARITREEGRFEVLAVHEEPGGLGVPEGLIAPLGRPGAGRSPRHASRAWSRTRAPG